MATPRPLLFTVLAAGGSVQAGGHKGSGSTMLAVEEIQYPTEPATRPSEDGDKVAATTTGATTGPTLAELIDAGESESLEFKATLRKNLHTGQHDARVEHGSLKTIAAFLNTRGGTLVVVFPERGQDARAPGQLDQEPHGANACALCRCAL